MTNISLSCIDFDRILNEIHKRVHTQKLEPYAYFDKTIIKLISYNVLTSDRESWMCKWAKFIIIWKDCIKLFV